MSDFSQMPAGEMSGPPRQIVMPVGANKRRAGLVLLGLALVAGAALGFWLVIQSVDQREVYVVAVRDIARWDQVSSADFDVVEANVGEATATTPSQMGAIYGQWATGPIPAGTLITRGMFRPPPLSSEDESRSIVIQISLPAGDVTYGELATGDTIALIGREPLPETALGLDAGIAAQEPPLSLIGILRLENVQGGNVVYVVEPARALALQRLVRRYLAATDRQIWRLGFELTADDVRNALDENANLVNNRRG